MPVEITDRGIPCILVFRPAQEETAKLTKKMPLPLLCVGNRYLIEHQLEWLSDSGFKNIRLSLTDRAHDTENLVGTGLRWGTQVTYSRDPFFLSLRDRLHKSADFAETGVLLLEGEALMRFSFPQTLDHSMVFFAGKRLLPMIYLREDDFRALLSVSDGPRVFDLCEKALEVLPHITQTKVDGFYQPIHNVADFVALNRQIEKNAEILYFKGSGPDTGIRIGRMTHISSGARIEGPAMIGDGALIKGDAHIGPGAFIGDHAYIDRGVRVVNAVVGPATYIGRNLHFEDKYVCRNYVLDLEEGTAILLDDPQLLGDLTKPVAWSNGLSRGIAFLLAMLATIPIILLLPVHKLLRGTWIHTEKILEQPVPKNLKGEHVYHWCIMRRFNFGFFILDIMPGLYAIAGGSIAFVGNPPLREQELEGLDEAWREDLLQGKVGFTGLVQQLDPKSATADDILATTIYYNATRSLKGDAELLVKALMPRIFRTLLLGKN